MKQSTSSLALIFLIGFCMLLPTEAQDCTSVNGTLCGVGNCTGYIFINSICTSSCGLGDYYQNSTGTCKSCSLLGSTDCGMSCPGFYYVASSNGNSNTTNNTTSNSTTPTCLSCVSKFGPGCSSCNALMCTVCISGLGLSSDNQTCIDKNCNISYCLQCAGKAACYRCQLGYQVNSSQTCAKVSCAVNYCSICSGTNCSTCILGYYISSGACLPKCDQYCTSCQSPGVCVSCKPNYILNTQTTTCSLNCSLAFGGLCQVCSDLLYCTTCKAGYVSIFNGAICAQIYNCADIYCAECSVSSICTTCSIGYKLASNSTCTPDLCFITDCLSCATFSTCATCATNFVLNSDASACIPSCVGTISNCMICSNTTTCQICSIGFAISSNTCAAICNISNCQICWSSNTCLLCLVGYDVSTDFTTCNILCGDPYCQICSTSTSCSSCVSGYRKGTSGKCLSNCRRGFTLNQNGTCQSCIMSINNCQVCALDTTNAIQCTSCSNGFYASSGNCFSCSSSLSNCLLCSTPSSCSFCAFGYVVSSGSCIARNCNARNCDICQTNSTSLCSTCSNGFKSDGNGYCISSCSSGQFLIGGVCTCPPGTYSTSIACLPCSDTLCQSCTINSCSSCANGYYVSGTSCKSCIDNCISCTDSTTCSICQPPYSYYSGSCTLLGNGVSGAVDSSGNVFTCDPGCDSCILGNNNILVCIIVTFGYTQVQGTIIKCDSSCKTCSSIPTTCLSCFSGYAINGGTCTPCSDSSATSCSITDSTYSLSCVNGYTTTVNTTVIPSTSTCQFCAGNCYKCNINGAGTCDPGQCQVGYVIQSGAQVCTLCFNGCPICDPNDLSSCLSCGKRRYKDSNSSTCMTCPSGCKECTDSSVCSSCLPGFLMVGTLCQAGPSWPCVQGTSSLCTKCVQRFILNNDGTCSYNNSCNATATCNSCGYGYYLQAATTSQGTCIACPSLSNCLTCDPSNNNACFLCNTGYYVSSGSCIACSTGCSSCSSPYYCSQAQSGYYLVANFDGSYSGQTVACTSPCLTCSSNPNFCLSCVSGFSISGSSCFSNKVLSYSVVFNFISIFSSTDIFSVAYGKILRNYGSFRILFCRALPFRITQRDSTCKRNFNCRRFGHGSVTLDAALSVEGYTSAADAQSDMSTFTLPGATILSTSSTVSGVSDTSSSSTNLGLILGISIPLGILLIVIIVVIIYSRKQETTEVNDLGQTGKQMQDRNGMEKEQFE